MIAFLYKAWYVLCHYAAMLPLVREYTRKKNEYIKMFQPYMFWDVKIDRLDYWRSKRLIIDRVVTRGNENDEKILYQMYPMWKIKRALLRSDEINEQAIDYYSFVFHIKRERFKRYSTIHLPMRM